LPLAVDLDGTLLKTDVLFESLALALKRALWLVIAAPFIAVLRGKPALKRLAARVAPLDPATLPYRDDVLVWLRAEHARGRTLLLATAADRAPAEAIAAHVGVFARVLASDGAGNLKGARKAVALSRAFPDGFAYAGDSRADLAVWAQARAIVLVDAAPDVERAAARLGAPMEQRFARTDHGWRAWLRALRVPHWSKNLLIFAPIFAALRFADPSAWTAALAGFAVLCALASATYVLNDLADLAEDRAHRDKRHRPFAAGALPVAAGLAAAPAAIAVSLGLALALGAAFLAAAAAYVVGTLAYSLALKRIAFLDALVLAGLFVLRVQMGVALIAAPFSPWLPGFAFALFLSLALLKRDAELHGAVRALRIAGRGYRGGDRLLVRALGVASGAAAVAILILYALSAAAARGFTAPLWLLALAPIVGLWLVRVWRRAAHGRLEGDPVAFALRDWPSWLALASAAAVYALAV
jgi:4-hydroxybenzoate polyprenyltransferase